MTWTLKVRTSPGALMTAEYECPVHGRFDATVARDGNGDPPVTVRCARPLRLHDGPGVFVKAGPPCNRESPWRISAPPTHTQFVVSASQGKAAPKPHPNAMDTRPLTEGRKNEWRKGRKKIRQEYRHARLKEYLR